MATQRKIQAERVGQTHPYQITCTACDTRLIAVDRDWIVLEGPRPIELVAGVDGGTHIACHHCGNMVLLDHDLLLLR
jgi:hypothetical protein